MQTALLLCHPQLKVYKQDFLKLEKYWSDWCLNIQKTKEMIFNKAGRNITQKLMFQNNMIDCVSSCKYLGVHLTVSGSFHEARSELYKKALKAYHILRNIFY